MRRFIREDRPFALTFGALLVLYTVPLLLPRALPLQDYAAHLRVVAVWRSLGDADGKLMASEHVARGGVVPYATYYYSLRALGAVMSLEAAQRLLIVLYGAALPLSLLALLLAFGRERRLSLLAFPLIYNTPFIIGLLPQAFSYPLMLLGLAQLKRYLDSPTLRREALLALTAALIYLTHMIGFAAFGLAALPIWVAHVRGATEAARRALWAVPALALALLWSTGQVSGGDLVLRWATPREMLGKLSPGLNDILVGSADEIALLGIGVSLLLCLNLRPQSGGDGARPARRGEWSLGVAALTVLAGFFVFPADVLKPVINIGTNVRLIVPAALLLLALPRVRLAGRRAAALLPALATSVALAVTVAATFSAFGAEARQLDEVLAKLPPNKRVLPLAYDAGDGVHRSLPYLHLPELYQVRKGGYIPYEPIAPEVVPFKLRGKGTPAPAWQLPKTLSYLFHGPFYHYFLVVYAKGERIRDAPFGANPEAVKLVARAGRFALYRNVGPFKPIDS